jgi:hypothetical protein
MQDSHLAASSPEVLLWTGCGAGLQCLVRRRLRARLHLRLWLLLVLSGQSHVKSQEV